ncbi:MAG: hypothetical protein HYV60_17690 [Planctomycetia bacterium]|nr:hypothetical protein [Planctomycetia bacterium]
MSRFILDFVLLGNAIALSILSGHLHRELWRHWYVAPGSSTEVPHLESAPEEVGDWKLVERRVPNAESAAVECCYANVETSQRIVVRLSAARFGKVWEHDLERTAIRHGYWRAVDFRRTIVTNSDGIDSFWKADLENSDSWGLALYAWSDGGRWTASPLPGITFAKRSLIYKLEIVVDNARSLAPFELERDFLKDFLPAIRECLPEAPTLRLP